MLKINKSFTINDYIEFRRLSNWKEISLEQASNSVINSAYLISVSNEDNILGIARCISDIGYLFLICDVMVRPDCQGKGIGKMLVEGLINMIKEDNKENYYKIYIMSLKGKEGFYKACGFDDSKATGLLIEHMEEK